MAGRPRAGRGRAVRGGVHDDGSDGGRSEHINRRLRAVGVSHHTPEPDRDGDNDQR